MTDAKWTNVASFFVCGTTSALGFTFLKCQVGEFLSVSHSLSAAALVSGICIAALMEMGLLVCQAVVEFRRIFLFSDMIHVVWMRLSFWSRTVAGQRSFKVP